ncbi:MFS transporter [Pseudoalteromonas sp. SCSIO 43210]
MSQPISQRHFYSTLLLAFLAMFDVQVTNLFVSIIQEEFSVTVTDASAIVSYYLIAELSVIPLFGLLVSLLGERNLLSYCSYGFIASSTLIAVCNNFEVFLMLRVLQGVFGGILLLFPYYIISHHLPQQNRDQNITKYMVVGSLAPLLSPLIGGLLVEFVSWRTLFIVNLPIGILCLLALDAVDKPETIQWSQISYKKVVSSLLVMVSLVLFESTLTNGNKVGWFNSQTFIFSLFAALALFMLFSYSQSHRENRLLNYNILKSFSFVFSCSVNALAGCCVLVYLFLLPFYLSTMHGFTPKEIGIFYSFIAIPHVIIIKVFGRFPRLFSYEVIAFGVLLLSLAVYGLSYYENGMSGQHLFASQLFRAAAIPLIVLSIGSIAFQDISRDDAKEAAVFFNLFRILGGIVGVALVGATYENILNGAIASLVISRRFDLSTTREVLPQHGQTIGSINLNNAESLIAINPITQYVDIGQAQKLAFIELFSILNQFLVIMAAVIFIAGVALRHKR